MGGPPTAPGGGSGGGNHTRTHTDNTNFTFLSALTDATGEFVAPKRRTLSWDNHDAPYQQTKISKKNGRRVRGATASAATMLIEHTSPGGFSLPGSILQPILTDDDPAPAAPPVSIWASTLRRATPVTPTHPSRQSVGGEREGSTGGNKVDNDFDNDDHNNHPSSSIRPNMTHEPQRKIHPVGNEMLGGVENVVGNPLPFVLREEGKGSYDRLRGSRERRIRELDVGVILPIPTSAAPAVTETSSTGSTEQKTYSLKDLLDATNEDTAETDIIQMVDTSTFLRDTRNVMARLFPQIPDDRVHDFERNYDDGDQPWNGTHGIGEEGTLEGVALDRRVSAVTSLTQLTRKLMEANHKIGLKQPSHVTRDRNYVPQHVDTMNHRDAGKIHPPRKPAAVAPRVVETDIEGRISSTKVGSDDSRRLKAGNLLRRLGCTLRPFREDGNYGVRYSLDRGESNNPLRWKYWHNFSKSFWFLVLPCILIGSFVFYVFDNTQTDRSFGLSCDRTFADIFHKEHRTRDNITTIDGGDCETFQNTGFCKIHNEKSPSKASTSWWLLCLGCREIFALFIARLSELVIIDFLTIRTRTFLKVLGTNLSLALAHSKGWPYLLFAWGLLDLILLFGSRRFDQHLQQWQDYFLTFSEDNPKGNVTNASFYSRWICICLGLGIATTVKRSLLGSFIGKRIVDNYRVELTDVMKKLLLLSEVASLSLKIKEDAIATQNVMYLYDPIDTIGVVPLDNGTTEDNSLPANNLKCSDGMTSKRPEAMDVQKSLRSLDQCITDFVQDWEDSECREVDHSEGTATEVLKVRSAFNAIDNDYPFSPSFGKASTRQECVEAAQTVFERLVKGNNNGMLSFDVLCRIALLSDGTTDCSKIRELLHVFRPCRKGMISNLDFVRSTDSVYKTLRLLIANANNSSQIDRSCNKIVDIAYFCVACFTSLAVLGVEIRPLFVTLVGFVAIFAFIIGSTSAKYLEGVLLILVQKPYGIGDRICFKAPTDSMDEVEPPCGGWIVENFDLYTTTLRSGTTRELTTCPNGSLPGSRIVNLQRSERANVILYLKFTIDVTQQQVKVFRRRITEFIKDRPREWIRLNAFRCRRVEVAHRYVEYMLIIQHREAWQNYPAVQQSKSDVSMFALDLHKALKMTSTTHRAPIPNVHDVDSGIRLESRMIDYQGDDPESISSERPLQRRAENNC